MIQHASNAMNSAVLRSLRDCIDGRAAVPSPDTHWVCVDGYTYQRLLLDGDGFLAGWRLRLNESVESGKCILMRRAL